MDRLLDATYLAERRHFWFRGLEWFSGPLIAQAVAGRQAPRILDCGFGTGGNMARLSKFGQVSGFDLATGGIGYARQAGQHRLAQASVTAIPFRSATFDLVTAFDLLACLYEDDQAIALAEMYRVLKPGGALMLNTAALPILRGAHAAFGQEVHRATRAALKRRIETAGFTVERLTYTNCSLFPLMLAVRLSQRALGRESPEESDVDIVVPPRWANEVLTNLLRLESRALGFVDMPFGSSLLGLAFKDDQAC